MTEVTKDVLDEEIKPSDDTTDWEARSKELENKIIRARESRKSQKDKYETEVAGLKAQLELAPKDKKSPELDYNLVEKALFKAYGLGTLEEQQLAKDFAKRTGEGIDAIMDDDIFQARLEKLRTTKANEAAADTQGNRSGLQTGKDTPEYWMSKLAPNEEIPRNLPLELRSKIVALRMNQGENKKMFYNDFQ
mgnify:CR=1 FL=1